MSAPRFTAIFATAALAVSALTMPSLGAAAINLDVEIAPPAPRIEVVPQMRRGYVWAPGHYVWRRHAHVWVAGHWLRERRGYRWVADEWVPAGPRWHYVPGHWAR